MGARNALEPSLTSASAVTFPLDQVIPLGLSGIPSWFVDSFRVAYHMLIPLLWALQKNVYSVFRAGNPGSVGFAQLSSVAGGSGESAVCSSR